jgi:hypothetical protein
MPTENDSSTRGGASCTATAEESSGTSVRDCGVATTSIVCGFGRDAAIGFIDPDALAGFADRKETAKSEVNRGDETAGSSVCSIAGGGTYVGSNSRASFLATDFWIARASEA